MPTYEYECKKCGHEFEAFQSITEEPLKTCPTCKGKVVRKIGTGAGLLFKGSGFYTTDYRSESYKKGAKSETKPSTSSGDSGSASSSSSSSSDASSKSSSKSE